ncbi:MAG: septum formation initiator family protein [Cyclobacteriaceae bacterium]|nr:septum formation initiator family protein [Cyclobacteriaceae bacterium]
MFDRLPKFMKSFYFVAGIAFLFWMLFIDSNDLFSQYKLTRQLKNFRQEKAYYTNKIEEVKKEREELLSNKALLEKFAREKYLMKKKSEDIYVIVEKEE